MNVPERSSGFTRWVSVKPRGNKYSIFSFGKLGRYPRKTCSRFVQKHPVTFFYPPRRGAPPFSGRGCELANRCPPASQGVARCCVRVTQSGNSCRRPFLPRLCCHLLLSVVSPALTSPAAAAVISGAAAASRLLPVASVASPASPAAAAEPPYLIS